MLSRMCATLNLMHEIFPWYFLSNNEKQCLDSDYRLRIRKTGIKWVQMLPHTVLYTNAMKWHLALPITEATSRRQLAHFATLLSFRPPTVQYQKLWLNHLLSRCQQNWATQPLEMMSQKNITVTKKWRGGRIQKLLTTVQFRTSLHISGKKVKIIITELRSYQLLCLDVELDNLDCGPLKTV